MRTLPNPPVVSSISPVAGLQGGGTSVTIEGSNLSQVSGVAFGASSAGSFTINSDSSITALSPSGSGTVDVTAENAGGTSATGSFDRFSYVPKGPRPQVSGVAPSSGPAAGGTSVIVTGSGFVGVTAVEFGASPAGGYATESATSLSATSPPLSAGSWHVTVTTPNGTSAISTSDRFRAGPPTVSSVSPAAGPTAGGTTVSVTGTGFAPGTTDTKFKFGATAASSVQCSGLTTCLVVSPARKQGSTDVRATVAGQTSLAAPPGDLFTFE
jgi:hypothetical protein